MLLSLIVYFILAFIMIYGGIISSIKQKRSSHNNSFFQFDIIFPLVTFAVVFGCRYDVGIDYFSYLDLYQTHNQLDRIEWLFALFIKLLSGYGVHFSVFFGLIAFLQIFFIFYAFKEERYLYPWISFVLFLGSYYLPMMNIMRQMLAASIFIYSIQFIDKKSFFKYFLLVIIATLIHRSSLLYLLLYPLFQYKQDYSRKIIPQLILLLICFLFYYNTDKIIVLLESLITYFTEVLHYEKYSINVIKNLSSSRHGRGLGIGVIFLLVQNTIIIFYSKRLKETFGTNKFLILYNLFLLGILIEMAASDLLMLTRPFRAFMLIKMIVVSYLLYYLLFVSKRLFDKYVFVFFIVQYIILFLNMISMAGVNKAQFHFFWQF